MLNKCPECGKEISDSAVSCPKCGLKLQKSAEENLLGAMLIMVAVAVSIIVLFVVFAMINNYVYWISGLAQLLIAVEVCVVIAFMVLLVLCIIRKKKVFICTGTLILTIGLVLATYLAANHFYQFEKEWRDAEYQASQQALQPAAIPLVESEIMEVIDYSIDEDTINVKYRFTNNTGGYYSASELYYQNYVYQDGISLREKFDYNYDSRVSGYLKNGATVEFELSYYLRNSTSPIEVERVSGLITTISLEQEQ